MDLPPQFKLHCQRLHKRERNRADGAVNFSPWLIQTTGADRLNSDSALVNDMRLVHLTRIVLHMLIKPQNTGLDWSWVSWGRNLESKVSIDQNDDIIYIKCAKRALNTHRRDSQWTCRALWVPPHVQSVSWHHKGPALPWDSASPELTKQQMHNINLMKKRKHNLFRYLVVYIGSYLVSQHDKWNETL